MKQINRSEHQIEFVERLPTLGRGILCLVGLQYIHGSTLMKLKEKRYPFREVAKIEVYTHEWESRPYTYGLEFVFSDQRKVKMGDVAEKEDAEALRDILLGWVAA